MESIVRYNTSGNLDDLQRTAKLLAASGYFDVKGALEVQVAQMATKILAGAELGFGPFAAVNGIHIIQGKPSIGANLMASAVKGHPRYDYRVRAMTDVECTIEFFEIADGKRESIGVSTFTKTDAETAGVMSNPTWKKYPKNMLFARAMSNGVRFYTPDVFNGNAVYVPEELGAEVDADGDVIDTTWTQPEATQPATIKTEEKAAQQAKDDLVRRVAASGTHAEESFENPWDDEPPADDDERQPETRGDTIKPATLRQLHKLGREVYGEGWDAKRAKLVESVSTGAATSSNELLESEAQKLIAGMKKKQTELEPA